LIPILSTPGPTDWIPPDRTPEAPARSTVPVASFEYDRRRQDEYGAHTGSVPPNGRASGPSREVQQGQVVRVRRRGGQRCLPATALGLPDHDGHHAALGRRAPLPHLPAQQRRL